MSLFKEIINGNITALGKAITLIESSLASDKKKAEKLLLDCVHLKKEKNQLELV